MINQGGINNICAYICDPWENLLESCIVNCIEKNSIL